MLYDEWTKLYRTLCKAKDRTVDGEQCAAYFDVLKDFPQSCVHQACFRASREVSGWPKSDRLVEISAEERRKVMAPANSCNVCHGETWVAATPLRMFKREYATVDRCPQCWTLPRGFSRTPIAERSEVEA